MKAIVNKLMPFVTNAAFAVALLSFGSTCRTWLYQPKMPEKLMEMDQ